MTTTTTTAATKQTGRNKKIITVRITFEKQPSSDETTQLIKDFIVFCQKKLKLREIPHIIFHTKRKSGMTTGSFDLGSNTIHVLLSGRLVLDALRTLAHELTHAKQLENGMLAIELPKIDPDNVLGDIDTPHENQAYTFSGNYVKEFCRLYTGIPKETLYLLKESPGKKKS